MPENDENVPGYIMKNKMNKKTFIDIDDLEADISEVTIKQVRLLCEEGYKHESHLKNHMIKKKQHDNELKMTVLQCPEYENFLSFKQALERHILNVYILNVHRDCKHCNISFSNESDFRSHLKTHK